jgi:hypothetical protein
MAVVLVVAALLLPIGWHLLVVSGLLDRWWKPLEDWVGWTGALLLYLVGLFGSGFAVVAAAQSIGVGGQALVAFGVSFFAIALFRYLNGEDIELG